MQVTSMGNKVASYIEKLQSQKDWDNFLMKESGLPGPRANLELLQVFADAADEKLINSYVSISPAEAPENSAKLFLVLCGVVGLGTLVNKGKLEYLKQLRQFASDPRWRVREAVAIALQRIGDKDMTFLLKEMKEWSTGNLLEKRAAAAALCEPRLLKTEKTSDAVLDVLDVITQSVASEPNSKTEALDVLKKALGYCWSVATAANPKKGKKLMEKWAQNNDKTIQWIIKENLKKKRLLNMDKTWVANQKAKLN